MEQSRIIFLVFLIFTKLCLANPFENQPLSNERESGSFYIKKSESKQLEAFYQENPREELKLQYEDIVKIPDGLCSFRIYEKLMAIDPTKIKFHLLALRDLNFVDDIIFDYVQRVGKLSNGWTTVNTRGVNKLSRIPSIEKVVYNFFKRRKRGSCESTNFKKLVSELRSKVSNYEEKHLKYLIALAKKKKWVSKEGYDTLEKLREGKVHQWNLNIKDYLDKKKSLRTQYPLKRIEFSEFVTKKVEKRDISLRQQLYQKYSYLQIILMGDIIKKLRRRMDATKIDIRIFSENDPEDLPTEIIELEPMERFRFVLKLLRKEMAELRISSLFANSRPNYIDIITAGFEMGIIPAEEVDEVATLEEIWNPKQSFWDKTLYWIKTFAPVATVVIPQPYGFLGVIALIALESSTTKKNNNAPKDWDLFGL